ncbi:hypothetical protein MYCTH_2312826 [Thermothelomyces thermophilus ATCC 42464]|uniref:Defect at low temperature protein 1 n=1 Tax=Thermothelomyces thermophilus (strain ATCC 42464 / BCRC 31852 / DSM 1799) TaxID=573729 RepID=G2QNA5_THET4|nr:uncharacterized protein MYCTH_2312826 [Thermothelomyces thermophilus ATCC 42464]AEO61978.1 hypothetical protein MYCTH_2312826 [Thermothelomyces thermophilus ATCC 42464]
MSAASLLFLIVYNFLYYFLYLVLFAFLVVTPIDLIQQGATRRRKWDILAVLVCYIATIVVVAFIYATRLYISRSVIASIPKAWIPIEKGDVPPDVRQMIVEGLGRSAAIAYDARPRAPPVVSGREPASGGRANGQGRLSGSAGSSAAASDRAAKAAELWQQHKPVWGEIEHPGWASPTSHDLPNLQYDTVVTELPNLIEAKAITLAPPDPDSRREPPTLDPDAVALLQRPGSMGLREYLAYLTELAVLAPLPTTTEFLARYEAARYSGRPLSNEQFRSLMHLFAGILHNMHPLSPAALARYEDDGDDGSSGLAGPSESDIDNDAPRGTSPSSAGTAVGLGLQRQQQQPRHHPSNDSDSLARTSSASTTGSGRRRLVRPGRGARTPSAHTWQFRTAPTTPQSRQSGFSGAPSPESFAHTRRPYPDRQWSSSSSSASARSVGGGSVIRLAGSEDATDLPYVITYSPNR